MSRTLLRDVRETGLGELAIDVTTGVMNGSLDQAFGIDAPRMRLRLEASATVLKDHRPLGQRKRLLEELVSVAAADGLIHPREIATLHALGRMVEVDSAFVDDALGRVKARLD